MPKLTLGIVGIFAVASALALATARAEAGCAGNPLLGFWQAQGVSVEANNHVTRSCGEAALSLTCAANGELELRWAYRCGSWEDWLYGGQKKFVLNGPRLTGVDGELLADRFYWDGLIPGEEYGTKVELATAGTDPNRLAFTLSENPQHYYPEDIFRGTFTRVSSAPDFLDPAPLFPDEKINGEWTGKITILGEKEVVCAVKSWNIRFRRQAMFQTHLYLPECTEDVNFWLGSNFVRGGSVFAHPRDQSRRLELVGTAHAGGFERAWKHYVVRKEVVELGDESLTYRIFTQEKEYRLELHRP